MKKIIIFSCLIVIFTACSTKKQPSDINEILMSLKNYSCSMQVESFSNKNTVTYNAHQIYQYPNNYSMEFNDIDKTLLSYNNNTLYISSNKLNILKSIENYPNINQNPLFLSYFLNTYFNLPPENISSKSLSEVSIILPQNNALLYKATLILENNIPNSLTYFDKNEIPKVNIIYNEFKSESL